MAAITIRDLDDAVKERLRVQAAQNGRSMEAEARALIEQATAQPRRAKNIGMAFYEAFREVDGVELKLPSRKETSTRPTPFSDEWEAGRRRAR
jgi:plasmid stability protein